MREFFQMAMRLYYGTAAASLAAYWVLILAFEAWCRA